MPIPKTRAEMEAQIDQLWTELRAKALDEAFPRALGYSAGDDDSGES